MRRTMPAALVATFLGAHSPALAHTSEQAFVLLLPTNLYTAAGVGAVALTVIVVAILPYDAARSIFISGRLFALSRARLDTVTSLVSSAVLAFLLYVGFTGPTNPLENLLPLTVWTVWWMGFVAVQALVGDLWGWVNPWTGLYRLFGFAIRPQPLFQYPKWLGEWPGVVGFLAFACFMLADIAPEDPARLATIVGVYWLYIFAGMIIFGGESWLGKAECFTILLRFYARLAIFARRPRGLRAGLPCWRLERAAPASISGALLVIFLLGTGSFDGLNETFWWLDKIGINPLEFPGRSAVVWPTILGLLAANMLLAAVFAATIRLGLMLARADIGFAHAFGLFALAILPIALGYHIAHYLVAFLVQAQYAFAALTDPWRTGADYLGLGQFYVTTGFLNTRATVEAIWLTQAGAVVIGHVLSVLVGHSLATRLFLSPRKAFASQIPLALFMILYTLFGLWLLATPRGA